MGLVKIIGKDEPLALFMNTKKTIFLTLSILEHIPHLPEIARLYKMLYRQ